MRVSSNADHVVEGGLLVAEPVAGRRLLPVDDPCRPGLAERRRPVVVRGAEADPARGPVSVPLDAVGAGQQEAGADRATGRGPERRVHAAEAAPRERRVVIVVAPLGRRYVRGPLEQLSVGAIVEVGRRGGALAV